jgi:hypothetical protein
MPCSIACKNCKVLNWENSPEIENIEDDMV